MNAGGRSWGQLPKAATAAYARAPGRFAAGLLEGSAERELDRPCDGGIRGPPAGFPPPVQCRTTAWLSGLKLARSALRARSAEVFRARAIWPAKCFATAAGVQRSRLLNTVSTIYVALCGNRKMRATMVRCIASRRLASILVTHMRSSSQRRVGKTTTSRRATWARTGTKWMSSTKLGEHNECDPMGFVLTPILARRLAAT